MPVSAFLNDTKVALEKKAAKASIPLSTLLSSSSAPKTSSGATMPVATEEKPAAARSVGIMNRVPKWALILIVAGGGYYVWKRFIKRGK